MKRIIFATGNQNKMKEIHMILADLGMPIYSMKEAGIDIDIVEDGTTFEENAQIKAKAIAKYLPDDIILRAFKGINDRQYLSKSELICQPEPTGLPPAPQPPVCEFEKKCAELLTTLAQNCTFAAILENIHEHLKNLVLWKTQTSSTLPSRAATFRTTGSTVSTPTANDARSACAIVPPWLSASRAYGATPSIHTLCARTGDAPSSNGCASCVWHGASAACSRT
jgi:hypothetical protein